MADITVKRGDTRPVLTFTLNQTVSGTATAINLTTASTVTLLLKDTAGATTGGGVCTIASAASGRVTYTLKTSDTNTVRTWNGEFEIIWADAGIETVPNEGYVTIAVVSDLGGS
jgi:hypothetical protein